MKPTEFQVLANAGKSQLLLVDVQTRLSQVMSDRKTLLKHCEMLVKAARLLSVPVTVTEQYPEGIGATEPVLMNALETGYSPIEKTCFSCCGSDTFLNRINQHKANNQLILCGIEAHVCVLQTAMDLLRQGKQVFIASDAVDSRAKENKRVALKRLQQAGAVITTTESVIFEWLKDAKHEQFKNIAALIR